MLSLQMQNALYSETQTRGIALCKLKNRVGICGFFCTCKKPIPFKGYKH